jgi:hypothetical protein
MFRSFTVFATWLAFAASLFARSPTDAPALPKAKGKVVTVSDVEELYHALSSIESNATVVLRKGTYQLHRPIHLDRKGLKNVTLRGETGRFEDVVIRGAGINNKAVYHGVLAGGVEGLVIADVTIGWVGYHPIALQPTCRAVRVYHCRLVDAGEQFIKASSDGKGGGADEGIVEYCILEYTKNGPPNGYTNGVDVHGGKNWIIRHNLFRNIRTMRGAEYKHVPAVLMWNGAKNTICEANTFVNCDRAVAFGLVQRNGFHDHEGGVVRNNFIYVAEGEVPHVDAGISVASPRTKVLHNTILLNGGYANAIETRWKSTTGVQVHNNLTDAMIVARSGARMSMEGNVTHVTSDLFTSVSAGNLHLTGKTRFRVNSHRDSPLDWDGEQRGQTQTTGGADEPVGSR